MARVSLREYQTQLAERLRGRAGAGALASKLGLQVGADAWLVDLADAGEVIPVPPIVPVPLAKPWFRGVSNIRGNLYTVVDFPAFLGGAGAARTREARLVLLGERLRSQAALLVDRSLGLRNVSELQPCDGEPGPWARARYSDMDGRLWSDLDLPKLAQHPDFLNVSA